MSSLKVRGTESVHRVRARWWLLDRTVRVQEHYTSVRGSLQAGAVTYYAFLSFFPLLAIAFFVVGYLARIYPDAQEDLVAALDNLLPGLIGPGEDQISLTTIQHSATTVGLIGFAALLYTGLSWLSTMRAALSAVFDQPLDDRPPFVVGKLRDLLTLGVIGLTLLLSVAIAGVVTSFSHDVLDLLGASDRLTLLLAVLGILVGGATEMVLFYAMFRLLARPRVPDRLLWSGALVGAVGAEALKYLSSYLIAATKNQPAFQAFGIALILLIWINYFSRVVVYAACWSATGVPAEATAAAALTPAPAVAGTAPAARPVPPPVPGGVWFGTGAGAMLALVALLRRRRR